MSSPVAEPTRKMRALIPSELVTPTNAFAYACIFGGDKSSWCNFGLAL